MQRRPGGRRFPDEPVSGRTARWIVLWFDCSPVRPVRALQNEMLRHGGKMAERAKEKAGGEMAERVKEKAGGRMAERANKKAGGKWQKE